MHPRCWVKRAWFLLVWLASIPVRALDPLPVPVLDENDRFQLVLPRPGWGGKLDLRWNGPPLVGAHVEGEPKRYVRYWNEQPRRGRTRIWVANVDGWGFPAAASFEVLTATRDYPDGRWAFRLEDAVAAPVSGKGVERYQWRFEAVRAGNYTVEVLGCSWREQTEAVEVRCGGRLKTGQLDYSANPRVIGNKSIGRMRIDGPGTRTLELTVGEEGRGRLGRALGVLLRPAPEGPRNRPGSDGSYRLPAVVAALEGRHLVVGPGTNSVSGWAEAGAALGWEFDDARPGLYGVWVGWRARRNVPERLEVEALRQKLGFRPELTDGEERWVRVGELRVERMADVPVRLRAAGLPAAPDWELLGLRLEPVTLVGAKGEVGRP